MRGGFHSAFVRTPLWLAVGVLLLGAGAPAKDAAPGPPQSPEELIEALAKDGLSGMAASRRLAAMGGAAMPILRRALGRKEPPARYWAIAALSSIGTDEAAQAILPLLDDPSALVRSVAVWHLGGWIDRPAVRARVLAKLEDDSPQVRGWVMRLIQTKRVREALPAVRQQLKSPVPEVRYDALHTVAVLAGAEALGDLARALREDEAALVREGALRCTTVIEPPTPKVAEVLILGLEDKEEDVRALAARLLRKGFGQYFGFEAGASPPERRQPVAQWQAWYSANAESLVWNPKARRFEIRPPGRARAAAQPGSR